MRLRKLHVLHVIFIFSVLLIFLDVNVLASRKHKHAGRRLRRKPDDSGAWSGPWSVLNESEIVQRSFEYQIKRQIFGGYKKSCRPVLEDNSSIPVSVGLTLYHILDTDEKHQTMSAQVAVRLRWMDKYLTWNASDFNNISKIWMPSTEVWLPDVIISNYAGERHHADITTNAIIKSSGEVLWMYPAVIKVYCLLDVQFFPFDAQICNITYFSWTFTGKQLSLHQDSNTNRVQYNPKNQEWFVDKIGTVTLHSTYVCCPNDTFPEVVFSIHMRRRSLFYIVNLIFPCFLIYMVAALGFFLPVESGDKINLEMTILLALVVFLLIAGEVLPPTPDAVPILEMFYGATMLMVTLALIMAVIVTNVYMRKDMAQELPTWVALWAEKVGFVLDHPFTSIRRCLRGRQLSRCCRPARERPNCHLLEDFSAAVPRLTVTQMEVPRDDEPSPEASWISVAQCIDRTFFYLFALASLFVLVVIFARVPT